MSTIENIKERYHFLQSVAGGRSLLPLEQHAFETFNKVGIPTSRNEEWKYTRIGNLFNKEFSFTDNDTTFNVNDFEALRMPGHENANEIVFINGIYSSSLSNIRSEELVVLPLQLAAESEYAGIVSKHLGHSSSYVHDGIHALNTAFVQQGIFIHVKKNQLTEHPVYVYHITDARETNTFSQPRSLVHVSENAQVQLVEVYFTVGSSESFTSQVMEIVVEKNALVEFYKIQNDASNTNLVSTTHFRLVDKSTIHAVTISLDGGIVRNNLNIALAAERSEAHLYGLYFLKGSSHVDNHTIVDHVKPNCESNELYKGIINDQANAVFNGKIFVQPLAQKTNAFQSNKNVLLSDTATVNTKPQLEIFADDVKCSHGCTVGRLDEEGLFYLRSRGISEEMAKSLLVQAFASDILEYIKLPVIREYVDRLISERLEFDKA
jgi:Fe-S cluster assembly protein SufD